MVQITIDTEKDSKKSIINMIDYLQTLVESDELEVKTTHSEPTPQSQNFFSNGLPSTAPITTVPTSANDLLNMCDDEIESEEEVEEIKPSKGLTDFSQFMPY